MTKNNIKFILNDKEVIANNNETLWLVISKPHAGVVKKCRYKSKRVYVRHS